MRCDQLAPTEANPSTGFRSAFSATSENCLPKAPPVCSAIATTAATGPPPRMKINTSATTISGIARKASMLRRNRGLSMGQRARPRVASSANDTAINAPKRVDTAAMFSVSISAGTCSQISAGITARLAQASVSTSAGKSASCGKPFQNPPALRISAVIQPDAIRATKMTIRMPPYIRLRRTISR